MELNKLTKTELLARCAELGITKCKSKTKGELVALISGNGGTATPFPSLTGNNGPPEITYTKPPIKWVGGKTQILQSILSQFPSQINNYHEPFMGGGSVLLALLGYKKNGTIHITGNIYAYDINEPLIYVYKNIQTQHNDLYDEIQKLIDEWKSCGTGNVNRNPQNINEAKENRENYYYWIRNKYNALNNTEKTAVIGSAMFIFMNKTCFRGVFRMGPNGFNVPYGHYPNPEIINKSHLDELHEAIQGVIFQCADFTMAMSQVGEGDFVYLDPPYVPEKETSFVGYTENGFSKEKHTLLFQTIHDHTRLNMKILMSNADVEMVKTQFSDKKYTINTIQCKRSIHSKKPDSTTNEVIIKNY